MQESYFHYLFGVSEDSYYGAIHARSGDAYLFMPRLPESFSVWFGDLPTPSSVKAKYGVQVGFPRSLFNHLQDRFLRVA